MEPTGLPSNSSFLDCHLPKISSLVTYTTPKCGQELNSKYNKNETAYITIIDYTVSFDQWNWLFSICPIYKTPSYLIGQVDLYQHSTCSIWSSHQVVVLSDLSFALVRALGVVIDNSWEGPSCRVVLSLSTSVIGDSCPINYHFLSLIF